jgi:hypothetical protein
MRGSRGRPWRREDDHDPLRVGDPNVEASRGEGFRRGAEAELWDLDQARFVDLDEHGRGLSDVQPANLLAVRSEDELDRGPGCRDRARRDRRRLLALRRRRGGTFGPLARLLGRSGEGGRDGCEPQHDREEKQRATEMHVSDARARPP